MPVIIHESYICLCPGIKGIADNYITDKLAKGGIELAKFNALLDSARFVWNERELLRYGNYHGSLHY